MDTDHRRQALLPLTLGAIGVVYGDIGTSPLYTMSTIFGPEGGVPLDATHLTGAASTIFWALMLVVTLKYVLLILRADNRGEGGIMALTALASQAAGGTVRRRGVLLLLGLFGAALFYGDSVITPAMSVLSAVEGLEVVQPALKRFVLPVAWAASAVSAMMPPSPRLSARRISSTYFSVTTIISAQKIVDAAPSRLAWVSGTSPAGPKMVDIVYSGLVPMSP